MASTVDKEPQPPVDTPPVEQPRPRPRTVTESLEALSWLGALLYHNSNLTQMQNDYLRCKIDITTARLRTIVRAVPDELMFTWDGMNAADCRNQYLVLLRVSGIRGITRVIRQIQTLQRGEQIFRRHENYLSLVKLFLCIACKHA